MTKASGKEYISHESEILGHIGDHFNNPDISDVTLTVGEQEFAAHRFVLAAQSKVFHTMLLGENWKESMEQKITLEESSHSETVFSDFLKFFYTGKLTLTMENVCGIRTLADKYDVPSLKEDCFGFMEDVLTGIHGDALESAFEWMQYIETYVPDLMATCYSAIRANIGLICEEKIKALKGKLTDDQLKNILVIEDVSDDVVITDEMSVLYSIRQLSSSKSIPNILPLIRFHNMSTDDLQKLEEEILPISGLQDYLGHAYKIQAERAAIFSKVGKKQRLSDGNSELQCRCAENSSCPHINPRLYINPPGGSCRKFKIGSKLSVQPIDLSDLEGFVEKVMCPNSKYIGKEWTTTWIGQYDQDPIYEMYTVKPALCHVGRRFSLALVCLDYEQGVHQYTIKSNGTVTKDNSVGETNSIMLKSPLRFKGIWEISTNNDAVYAYGVSILLHK